MECCRTGCARKGDYGLEVRFWGKGRAKGTHSPAKVMLSVPCCLGHALEAKPDELLNNDFWLRVESALMAMGHVGPERSSVEIHPVPLEQVNSKLKEIKRDPYTLVFDAPGKLH